MRLCEGSPSSDKASIAFEALHGKRRASGMSKVSPSSGMDIGQRMRPSWRLKAARRVPAMAKLAIRRPPLLTNFDDCSDCREYPFAVKHFIVRLG